MSIILRLILTALVILGATYLIPGISVSSFLTAILVAVVLAVVSVLIKPIFIVLTLPLTILTLGLFTFVVNAFMVWLTAWIVPGFTVAGFVPALLLSLLLSVAHWLISGLIAE